MFAVLGCWNSVDCDTCRRNDMQIKWAISQQRDGLTEDSRMSSLEVSIEQPPHRLPSCLCCSSEGSTSIMLVRRRQDAEHVWLSRRYVDPVCWRCGTCSGLDSRYGIILHCRSLLFRPVLFLQMQSAPKVVRTIFAGNPANTALQQTQDQTTATFSSPHRGSHGRPTGLQRLYQA